MKTLPLWLETRVRLYNHERYHESVNSVTPANAYFGRAETTINQRAPNTRLPYIAGLCGTKTSSGRIAFASTIDMTLLTPRAFASFEQAMTQ